MKDFFINLASNYTTESWIPERLWNDVNAEYSKPDRYYHNLDHIGAMLETINNYKNQLIDRDAVYFAIYYHDIIYTTYNSDNEARSANFMVKVLAELNIPQEILNKAEQLINLTNTHNLPAEADSDSKIFIDADLAILGTDAESYDKYSKAIRKEYKQYPDILYNPGRKKVLKRFLESEFIYNTREFRNSHEKMARLNLSRELNNLTW